METPCEPKNLREAIAQALEGATPAGQIMREFMESEETQRLGEALHRATRRRENRGSAMQPNPESMPLLP